MRKILPSVFILLSSFSFAQTAKQVLRGVVVDRETNMPLMGVNVAVYLNDKLIGGAQTNENGLYRIEDAPITRVNVTATYLGYRKVSVQNVQITSAKEMVIRIEMDAAVQEIKEVQVNGKRKGEVINEMATLSAHSFNVDDAARYAGSRNDPARMASNFAGVSGTDDSRNDIVIRGNSPFGVQWRLENVNIPSPTHFAIAGTTGGPIGILSNKVLSNSDFLTGAFPAEYGNATAGVFDVRFKNGNDEKHEFGLQFGLFGAEAFAEGPLNKKDRSSYIINFRYATLDLLVKAGIDIGTKAIPKYQDLQFKFNFPLKKGANLSFFGVGGYSFIDLITSKDKKPERDIYASKNVDEFLRTGVGIFGITLTRPVNEHCYSKFTVAASTQFLQDHFVRIARHVDPVSGEFVVDNKYDRMHFRFIESKYSVNFFRNYKLNPRHVLRYGMNNDVNVYNYSDSILDETTFVWNKRMKYKGAHFLFQPFVQWKWNITEKVTLNAGLHGQLFTLNNSWSLEPRLAIKYQFKQNQSVALGTGLHSQMQPAYIYFQSDNVALGDKGLRNVNLGFTRSYHLVGAYDIFFKQDVRIKIEAYFQYLFGIPVEEKSSSYSVINEGASFDRFFPGKLVNSGVGRNVGIELTVEKFFTHNWFVMFSGSAYDSKYRASDKTWYNTSYNGNYIVNLLGTKEFKWGKKRVNVIGIGGKITLGGGLRYTPYDTLLSKTSEDGVVQDKERNKYQFKPYFRFDVKLNYSWNGKKHITQEVGIDLVNVTMQKNILKLQYVDANTKPQEVYQLGFLPLFYYRIDFSFRKKNT